MADILQIIKYEGDNSTFIWKHPTEDFNLGSQLIVHESQEALFYMNGQALDLFPPGRHTLNTQNIPLIGKYFNLATDKKSPFHCEVYFINKVEQMAVKWGTDSRIEYIEPTYNFPLSIGANGEMSLRAEDSRKLLIKVVGTEKFLNQQLLMQKFRGFLMTHVKTYLANYIREKNINIFAIDEHLFEISAALQQKLAPDFLDYGIALERFFVMSIVKPEDERAYLKFKELHFRKYADVAEAELRQKVGIIDETTTAQRKVIEAQSNAQKRAVEGYSYQDERKFDTLDRVASNEAVGQMSNLGIGIGMISGVGGTIGSAVGETLQGTLGNTLTGKTPSLPTVACTSCGKAIAADSRFCPQCGAKVTPKDEGLVTCPKCGSTTPAGKFCKECGAALALICPNCKKELQSGSKFCAQCGYHLEEEK